MFGAGGGTSSYSDIEDTDFIVLWGSNAREAHPIFFHHVLTGIRNGAKMYVVDPRRTTSAQWADQWLGLEVGSDIALANTLAREIISAGLVDAEFIGRATTGFDEFRESVQEWTLERGEQVTGIPAALIKDLAHSYATADRAQICWTLGITEHITGVDNVLALINLALLTGNVGKPGAGLNPLRGQNNVQGGGDMGAIPNKYPGFRDVESDEDRLRFEKAWGVELPAKKGMHLSEMFEAMGAGDLRALYVMGENPAESEADVTHARKVLSDLDILVVQDIVLTATAQLADVVLPSAADWCEAEGTVTNSERRVQRCRKALDPPGEARPDLQIIAELARRMGHDWPELTAEDAWDELRSLSKMHEGMSYARLEEHGGLQWPCPDEDHPGTLILHERLWTDPLEGPPVPLTPVEWKAPIDALSEDFPLRMTTVRRLDSYNTGVQTDVLSAAPLRQTESLRISPEDGVRLGLPDGAQVRVSSRRGSIEVPLSYEAALRPGLTWMTPHASEEADVNVLTAEDYDPKSGTAEFKAVAIRVEAIVGAASDPAGIGATKADVGALDAVGSGYPSSAAGA